MSAITMNYRENINFSLFATLYIIFIFVDIYVYNTYYVKAFL